MANNNIKEVIINKITKLVYRILPIDVICDKDIKIPSQDLPLTMVILTSVR